MSSKIIDRKNKIAVVVGVIVLFVSAIFWQGVLGNRDSNYLNSSTDSENMDDALKSEKELRYILGQNFIVGIPGTTLDEKTKDFLDHIKPAGIILYRRNYEDESQLKQLILELQKFADESTESTYFIMLDEEPDGASRLGLLKGVFSLGLPVWEKIENDIKILSDIGINVILAPLADFPFNENSFVKRRIPVNSKEDLKSFNRVFIDLLKENGISGTLKHFPGIGVSTKDPHKEEIYINTEKDDFISSLNIFKDGIEHGVDFVMTSHAAYSDIDPVNSATFSPKIVEEILIDELNFQGIIITDDLSDMPLVMEEIDLTRAGIKAIKAGHHLIMFSHRMEETEKIFDEMVRDVENDYSLQKRVENNYQKIKKIKADNF